MKHYSFPLVALLTLSLAACEDVPAPYEVVFGESGQTDFEGQALPFTSANLRAGFDIFTPSDYPMIAGWSTGSSYVQVTGYVDSDGDGTKEYNLTQSWLITPALYMGTNESLVLNFDYTIRYANSMSAAELAANHKVMVSKDYTGDVALATWEELPFRPKASPYSDWTLYGSHDIEIPEAYRNCDNVRVAFFYQVTDTKKVSTWELQNLMIYAGMPEDVADDPVPGDTGETRTLPWTSTNLGEFAPITVRGIDWSLGSTYAKASGYVGGSYTATDAWLVSPAINTTTQSGVIIDVEHVIRYVYNDNDLANHTMWASTDYAGNVETATWTKLNYKPVASTTNTWDFYTAQTVGLPESLLNKEKVYIAYRYQCSSESASTWELKEFSIKEGTAPDTPVDPQPSEPAEQITIAEFLSRADVNTTYRLTGTVSNISSTLYGNFDLVDETGSIYIYGLLDKNGQARNFESIGIKEGDTVTLEGKYMEYNGKPEISNAQYISHTSSGSTEPSEPAEQITIGEFLTRADAGTTYRLTGTVENIVNTTYGNFDLVDETGKIYIYGLLDKDGNVRNFESLGIKEGDILTLEGVYGTYNDSPQIKNAQYISHTSSGDTPVDPQPPTGDYVTLSFADNVFGIDSEKQYEAKTYTYQGYSVTITPAGDGNSFYYNTSSQYFILGKEGATLEFGAFDFPVSAIEITGRDAASASVKQNIFVGDAPVSTETTGAKGTNLYRIDADHQAAGTRYTLKVLSAHNTQITEIKLYKAQ